MKGSWSRYFAGKPLYTFGYGLSYTTFSYRGLRVPKKAINAGDPLIAEVTVTNTGMRDGDEVVQLYLSFPDVPGAPLHALRGFKRVHLKSGESQNMRFELKDRDLRSEEHTSELQSQSNLVCRLLLEKKKNTSQRSTSQARARVLRRRNDDGTNREGDSALPRS